jgi:hypothetical protein
MRYHTPSTLRALDNRYVVKPTNKVLSGGWNASRVLLIIVAHTMWNPLSTADRVSYRSYCLPEMWTRLSSCTAYWRRKLIINNKWQRTEISSPPIICLPGACTRWRVGPIPGQEARCHVLSLYAGARCTWEVLHIPDSRATCLISIYLCVFKRWRAKNWGSSVCYLITRIC